MIFIDYAVSETCKNLVESYGMICVKCGECGREFDEYGVLINGDAEEGVDYDGE